MLFLCIHDFILEVKRHLFFVLVHLLSGGDRVAASACSNIHVFKHRDCGRKRTFAAPEIFGLVQEPVSLCFSCSLMVLQFQYFVSGCITKEVVLVYFSCFQS